MPSAGSAKRLISLAILASLTTACATSVGPTRKAVENAPATANLNGIRLVEINDPIARQTAGAGPDGNFAANLGDATPLWKKISAPTGQVYTCTIFVDP